MRQWEKKITEAEAGLTLEQLLRGEGFSKKEISRLKFKKDGLTVDKKQCRSTERLHEGQMVAVRLGNWDKNRKESRDASASENSAWKLTADDICYEDADLLIVHKPSGISCHPGRGHFADNLGTQIQAYCCRKGEAAEIRLIGRLDKDTSGGVVFARNQIAAARLWKQRENGSFRKTYEVLVHGHFPEMEGTIDRPIRAVPGEKNRMQVAEADEGLHAVTHYIVRKQYVQKNGRWTEATEDMILPDIQEPIISLLQCRLKTGRTHQIRVHMASIGHPVLGDAFYGINDDAKRLCLHAGEIVLKQPFNGRRIEVHIPVKGIPFER